MIPFNIKELVFKFYQNPDYFQWIGKKQMNTFFNERYFRWAQFKMLGVEGIKFNYIISPNGDRIEFKINIDINDSSIHDMTFNITLYSPEIKRYYCNTINILRSGCYGADNLINLSQCLCLKKITFMGKLQVLQVVKYSTGINMKTINFVQGIKMKRKTKCVWDIKNLINHTKNNDEVYSPYFGHSNNWIFFIKWKTNELYIRLMKLPCDIRGVQICLFSTSLYPLSRLINFEYSHNTSFLQYMHVSSSMSACQFEIEIINVYDEQFKELNKKQWINSGIID